MANKKFRGHVIMPDKLTVGSTTCYTQIDNDGDITQAGAASAVLGRHTTGSLTVGASGHISQTGTASAALGDVTTSCLTVGSGDDIQKIQFGSFSPCFNVINSGKSGTGSGAITGMTTSHKVIINPCCAIAGASMVMLGVCPAAGKVFITLLNVGDDNMGASSTCPWSYIAFK